MIYANRSRPIRAKTSVGRNWQRWLCLLCVIFVLDVFGMMFPVTSTMFPIHRPPPGRGVRPNILMIIADDLRPALGCYGDPEAHTPNIDELARRSVQFNAAFAQQALCAPSRNSLLTSRRPDTLKLYDFYSYWREFSGNFTTLPEFFKNHGYHAVSVGKVFHPGISANHSDDSPYSWSQPPYHPSTRKYKDATVCSDDDGKALHRNIVCPVDVADMPEGTLPDIQSIDYAMGFLDAWSGSTDRCETQLLLRQADCSERPFFLAVGLHKPHIPLKYPKEFLDWIPLENIHLPDKRRRPDDYPPVAWNPWTDLREREDIAALNLTFPYEPIPDGFARKLRQSYLAATAYIDHLIGRLLGRLHSVHLADNTIVVLFGDHGWTLGELGEWSKNSNMESALRVPLLISAPRITGYQDGFGRHASRPSIVDDPVELVDVFPTLVDIAGLGKLPSCPTKSAHSREVPICTEGKSLRPFLEHAWSPRKKNPDYVQHEHTDGIFAEEGKEDFAARGGLTNAAFSQYPRPGPIPTAHPNSDKPRLKQIKIMGYSVRMSTGFRYTEWVRFSRKTFQPSWKTLVDVELYDYRRDPFGAENRARDPQYALLRVVLSKMLHERFQ